MKKFTPEEVKAFQQLNPPTRGRVGERPEHVVAFENVEVNEGMFISKEEWGTKKSTPTSSLAYYYPKRKFSYQTVPTGWLVIRTV